jgi:hypothetical protein
MANKRRSRSGVSFARAGDHVAAFHGELNSRAGSLECVVHPTPKQARGRFWSDPAAMLMLLDWRQRRNRGCWEHGRCWSRSERRAWSSEVGHPTFASDGLRPDRGAGRSRLLSGACTSRVPDGCCFRDRGGSVLADRWRAGLGCASLASACCCLAWAAVRNRQGASRRRRRESAMDRRAN